MARKQQQQIRYTKNDNGTASLMHEKKREYELAQRNNNTETRKTTRTVRKQN